MITSKGKVIAHHTIVSQKLEMAEIRNRNQESTIKSKNAENAELKNKVEEQRDKIECSKRESAAQLSAKLRLLGILGGGGEESQEFGSGNSYIKEG